MVDDRILLAKDWLLHSGIQNLDVSQPHLYGSFNSWYDIHDNDYPYAYSEVTGYGVTLLCYLHTLFHDPLLLERATLAGQWLVHQVGRGNGSHVSLIPLKLTPFNQRGDNMYAFDTGMILNGLVNLFRLTHDDYFLHVAKNSADFLLFMQKESGEMYPIFKHMQKKEYDDTWSTQSGSYLAKIVIGLFNLYDVTHDEKYKNASIRLLDAVRKYQLENGRFISHKQFFSTHCHSHCYSTEAFLCAGLYLDHKEYISVAKKATEWLLASQSSDGSFPRLFFDKTFNYHLRVDVHAQSLRLIALLHSSGYLDDTCLPFLEKGFMKLAEFQREGDTPVHGGFVFGYQSDGQNAEHVNSWCTMFALQALLIHKGYIKDIQHFFV